VSALLRRALTYAADGLPVFPLFEPIPGEGCSCGRADCRSGHPRTAHGLHDASTDAETIERWWRRSPAANIGLRTGTRGGIIVVDVDSTEAGLALIELEQDRGLGGLLVRTGRGHHIWFRTPAGGLIVRNSQSELAAGIDVRGEGGYVVAPPSLHRSGLRYRFAGGRLEPPPTWLLERIAKPKAEPPRATAPLVAVADTASAHRFGAAVLAGRCDAVRNARRPVGDEPGERNSTLLRSATLCGGYIATGAIDEEEARSALLAAACAAGLLEKEARATIASGFKRGRARPLYVEERAS
jgi:Bifunctional DNA primase/polymerase, N-terminal